MAFYNKNPTLIKINHKMIHTEQHMILSLAATIYCPGVLLKLWFPQTLVFKNSLTPSNTNLPKQIYTKGNIAMVFSLPSEVPILSSEIF